MRFVFEHCRRALLVALYSRYLSGLSSRLSGVKRVVTYSNFLPNRASPGLIGESTRPSFLYASNDSLSIKNPFRVSTRERVSVDDKRLHILMNLGIPRVDPSSSYSPLASTLQDQWSV